MTREIDSQGGADPFRLETLAVRAGQERSQFGEHAEALYLTSSFVFESAAQAAARFSGEEAGNVYSRFTNPTVTAFQARLAALEGAEACVATASGMSAILSLVMGLCSAGDHIVASSGLFGATQQLFSTILPRFGVNTTFVSQTDASTWDAAIRPETKLFFLETPSNPLTEIADIPALVAIARARGIRVAVDNCFCTPILQRPLELGADLVVHSATKYIDGQGRVLGGAVAGAKVLTCDALAKLNLPAVQIRRAVVQEASDLPPDSHAALTGVVQPGQTRFLDLVEGLVNQQYVTGQTRRSSYALFEVEQHVAFLALVHVGQRTTEGELVN